MFRNVNRILAPLCVITLLTGVTFAAQKKGASKKTPKSQLVDINSASAEELAKLPGIDAATAQKIVQGQPNYKSKRDLLTQKIVDKAEYDKIQDKIVAHRKAGAGKGKAATKKGSGGTTPPK